MCDQPHTENVPALLEDCFDNKDGCLVASYLEMGSLLSNYDTGVCVCERETLNKEPVTQDNKYSVKLILTGRDGEHRMAKGHVQYC